MKKISFSLLFIVLLAVISFSCSNVSDGGGANSTWNSPKEVLENLPLASYSELQSRAASAETAEDSTVTEGESDPIQNGEPETIPVKKKVSDHSTMIIALLKYGVAPNIGGIAFGEEFPTGPINITQKILDELEDGSPGILPSFDVRVDKISDDRFDIICDVTYTYSKYFIEVSTNQDTVEAKSYYYYTFEEIENKAYIHMKRTGAGFERDWCSENHDGERYYAKATGEDGTILSYEKGYFDGDFPNENAARFQIFDGTYAIQIKAEWNNVTNEKIADSDGNVISNPTGEAKTLLEKYNSEFTTRKSQGVDFFTIKKLPDDFDSKFDDPIFNKIEPSQI